MRIVPILYPSDLGRSDKGTYVLGGSRGAPDVILDGLEGEGLRLNRPIAVPVEVPSGPDPKGAPLKFDAAIANATRALAEVVEKVNSEGNFPLILGGDHTTVLGHLMGHSVRHKAGIGLAVLADAYLDFERPAPPVFEDKARLRTDAEVTSTGDAERMVLAAALKKFPEGSELAKLMQGCALNEEQTSVIGVRSPRSAQVKALEKHTKMQVWDMERLEFDGEGAYRSMLTRHLSMGPIVLSLDATGLDPDMMTASRNAPPDGLEWSFMKRSLEQCLPHVDRILGLDISAVDHTADSAHQRGLTRFTDVLIPFLKRLTR